MACDCIVALDFKELEVRAVADARLPRSTGRKRSKIPLPSVKEGIAYIETSGWLFERRRGRSGYLFRKPGDTSHHRGEITFTLRELRDAVRYGL